MKAIILEWREKEKTYQKRISRGRYLQWLQILAKREGSNLLRAVIALSKDVDIIFVDVDKDLEEGKKSIVFKYEANAEYRESSQKINVSTSEISEVYHFIEAYCQEKIVFKIIENKKIRTTRKSKEELISTMKSIRDAYPCNNEISTKLCVILPETYTISINRDRNASHSEEPFIVCETMSEEIPVKIKNNHKIIWAQLDEWCE